MQFHYPLPFYGQYYVLHSTRYSYTFALSKKDKAAFPIKMQLLNE